LQRGRDALAAFDRGLRDGRPFVTGNDYTVADIALCRENLA
jgi:glutathione S-transferase